jgi:hypothetical protein
MDETPGGVGQLVRELVQGFIRRERTIIVAAISCRDDINNQVWRLCLHTCAWHSCKRTLMLMILSVCKAKSTWLASQEDVLAAALTSMLKMQPHTDMTAINLQFVILI